MKNRQKAQKGKQNVKPALVSQSPGELTDEQLQQVVGGVTISPTPPPTTDEVVVSFEYGDIRRPFVLGGLWNG